MTSREFDDIAAGLEEALQYASGADTGARTHEVEVPRVDVAAVRAQMDMSQAEFAEAFGVSVATVRNWEQGRRTPRGPARVLLNVIAHEPEAVQRVLAHIAA